MTTTRRVSEAKKYPTEPGALVTRGAAPHSNGTAPTSDIIDCNPDYLTIDEIDQVEEMLGGPMDMMGKMSRRGPALRVIATVMKRRTDPDFRFEDAGSLKIKFGEPAEIPPTSDGDFELSQPSSNTTE